MLLLGEPKSQGYEIPGLRDPPALRSSGSEIPWLPAGLLLGSSRARQRGLLEICRKRQGWIYLLDLTVAHGHAGTCVWRDPQPGNEPREKRFCVSGSRERSPCPGRSCAESHRIGNGA